VCINLKIVESRYTFIQNTIAKQDFLTYFANLKIQKEYMTFDLEYNSEREHLIIPEYGRHLQKLVNQV